MVWTQQKQKTLRRGGKNTQKTQTKKDLHNPDNHDDLITHLEPDILVCEGKWTLGSIIMNKASGGDVIPVEPFEILKDDAMKVLHSVCQKIQKTQWSQDWKSQFSFHCKERQCQRMFKLPHDCTHFTCQQGNAQNSLSQASIVLDCELPDVQTGFRKGRAIRDQIANICYIIKKARESQNNIYLCFIDYGKAFDHMDHNKLLKILQEMGIPDCLTCLLRNLYAGQEATVRTGDGTMDWFKLGKEYANIVYCHPAYLTYLRSTSSIMMGWTKPKLDSRLVGEISITSDMQMTPPLWEKAKN